MKAAEYHGGKDVRIVELPVPRIGAGELLVRVSQCGICGSDILDWYAMSKSTRFFGHEISGVIEAVGPGLTDWTVGERVFVHHHVPCFICHHCLRGNHTLCRMFHNTRIDPGGMAEYVRVPRLNVEHGGVIRLSDGVSLDEASLIEPVACCLRGLKKVNLHEGDTVLVMGGGFTGLVHARLAKILGAGLVGLTDYVDFKLQQADEFGVDFVANSRRDDIGSMLTEVTGGRAADVVVITPGSIAAVEEGMRYLGKGGTLYIFGLVGPDERVPVSPHSLLFSELRIVAAYSASPMETHTVYRLMETGNLSFAELITHRFPLEEAGKAIRVAMQHGESLKVVVELNKSVGSRP